MLFVLSFYKNLANYISLKMFIYSILKYNVIVLYILIIFVKVNEWKIGISVNSVVERRSVWFSWLGLKPNGFASGSVCERTMFLKNFRELDGGAGKK